MHVKKSRFIAIIIIVIIVCLAYYIAMTLVVDSANRDMLKVMENNYKDRILISDAIKSTDMAIFMMPWEQSLRFNRRMLFIQVNEYTKALEAVQDDLKVSENGLAYEYEGLCYEFLNQDDKARESYRKALQLYENELKEMPKDDFHITEMATLSMILGDTLRAQELINRREIPKDSLMASYFKNVNHLILNYKSGGLRYFYEKAKLSD